ncbi:hypothetical protein [endosymbiont GvMRE of Glomus versiforme]|uniref:hypothetical protein n=1 Tax=endosymbiont GvMRE of Glomus versiforme TaxID=2039283 RepID=UPI000EED501C|nr:hypothetical protein [endosymbiont GvMRE of Glomus versiforme]RHZ37579.1 hypothetical protein GvMRE_I1g505 [endosymbiont GvMRE of Glomus versiforme]
MAEFYQRIKALEEKLKKLDSLLNVTEQGINKLWTERQLDKNKIKSKELELEEWYQKLENCQQEKTKMEKELKAQILELKKNEFSKDKVDHLLNGENKELEKLGEQLYAERTHYYQIQNKLIGKLCEPCDCGEKDQKISNLFITIWIMLGFFFVFQIWFLGFVAPKYIKKRKEMLK